LGVRPDRARPQVAREVIVDFIAEVVGLAEGCPVLIVLDRCDRLNEESLRILADLGEVLPRGAQIWAAAKSDSPAGVSLRTTDASVHAIPPLDQAAIAGVLERRGLPTAHAEEVLIHTGGTALDVQAYIGLLETGETDPQALGESSDRLVARDTARRLHALPSSARQLTLRFAALSDPLPRPRLVRLARGDEELLDDTLTELARQGLLTAHAEGEWLHERRGAAALTLADEADRRAARADAAQAIWQYLRDEGEDRWLVELARRASQAPTLAAEDDTLAGVLALDESELALVAASIELTEPGHEAVDADAALSYARSTYPTDGDDVAAIERLAESDVMVMASDAEAAAVVLRLSP
jgi:hypothetical protein